MIWLFYYLHEKGRIRVITDGETEASWDMERVTEALQDLDVYRISWLETTLKRTDTSEDG